jgi:integrase
MEFIKAKPYLLEGKSPPTEDLEELTIRDLCNLFLDAKRKRTASGELSVRIWSDYRRMCHQLCEFFGRAKLVESLVLEDFRKIRDEIATGRGLVTLQNFIRRAKVLFNWAFEEKKIDEKIRFGESFDKPTAKNLRRERNAKPARMLQANEIRQCLEAAKPHMRAMILLGANCGLGNTDISCLPMDAIDLKNCWLNFPRPKTEVLRACNLWPETVTALSTVLADRPVPKSPDAEHCVFVTKYGRTFVRNSHETQVDGVAQEFSKLLRKLGIKRDGISFYALRHTFQTIADDVSNDNVAISFIMGHATKADDMASVYREFVRSGRLDLITSAVRSWLWPTGSEETWLKADEKVRRQLEADAATKSADPFGLDKPRKPKTVGVKKTSSTGK